MTASLKSSNTHLLTRSHHHHHLLLLLLLLLLLHSAFSPVVTKWPRSLLLLFFTPLCSEQLRSDRFCACVRRGPACQRRWPPLCLFRTDYLCVSHSEQAQLRSPSLTGRTHAQKGSARSSVSPQSEVKKRRRSDRGHFVTTGLKADWRRRRRRRGKRGKRGRWVPRRRWVFECVSAVRLVSGWCRTEPLRVRGGAGTGSQRFGQWAAEHWELLRETDGL